MSGRNDGAHLPVTRAEFARAWAGVKEVAVHVDQLKTVVSLLTARVKQLDQHVADLTLKVEAMKVDA